MAPIVDASMNVTAQRSMTMPTSRALTPPGDGAPQVRAGADVVVASNPDHGARRIAALLADGRPLDRLWRRLAAELHHEQRRPVLAYKLLVGKRPRLLPVFDSQVAELLRECGDGRWWRPVWEAVRRDGVHDQLVDLKRSAGLPDEVSPLRVLDVVAWMRAQERPRCEPGVSQADSGIASPQVRRAC